MTSFPLRLAFDEVLRNLESARLRTATLMLLSIAIGAAVTLATLADLGQVSGTVRQQYEAGSSAFEVVGPSGTRVSAARCHAIESVDGVTAAGGVMSVAPVRVGTQPDADARLLTVTPGFTSAAWPTLPQSRAASVVAGSAYADLTFRPGDTVNLTARGSVSTVRLDAVATTRSMLGYERVIVTRASPQGTVGSCLVLADPTARAAVAQAVRGWFGTGTSVNDVFVRSELTQDPQRLLSTRLSRFGWVAGGAALIVVVLTHWVARRGELALYRLHGVADRGVLAMFSVETAFLALVPAHVGVLLALGIRPVDPLLASSLTLDLLRLDLVTLIAPVLGLVAVPRASLLATLKGQ